MLFLLFLGICLWLTGVVIAIACGLPLLAMVAKIVIEMFIGYKIFCAIKRKREQRQHEINRIKGLM